MALARLLPTVAASNAAFFAVFGVFVVAMLVLIFLTLRWVIGRDRAGRKAWVDRQVARQQDADAAAGSTGSPPSNPHS
jgi:hypothetical protein